VYAIVRCGGRQEKAAVDDVLTVDTLPGEVGSSVTLPAILVVDGSKIVSDPAEVGRYQVTAEIMGAIAGPKINMIHYRNKTGYRRRLGHRQHYTQVRITGISADGSAPAKRGAARSTAKPDAGKAAAPKASAEKAPVAKAPVAKAPAAKAPAGKAPAARSGPAKSKPGAAGKKD
jgi:large subunit ribosomal protein L21